MDEKVQELINLCKVKGKKLVDKLELMILLMPPSSLRGTLAVFKNIYNYESKREKARVAVRKMGGYENVLKEYHNLEYELANIKADLAEYIDDYSLEELRDMVSGDDYEWLVTNEEDIKQYLKGTYA